MNSRVSWRAVNGVIEGELIREIEHNQLLVKLSNGKYIILSKRRYEEVKDGRA